MSNKTRNKLVLTQPSDKEVVLTRVFEAPRELVFKAFTDARLIPQWWGPRGHKTVVDKLELRPGGAWRIVSTDTEGGTHAFRGTHREITPPLRIVRTFEYEPMAGHISVESAEFSESQGKTTVTITSTFSNQADRDGMVQSGMEWGATQTMDRLEELLALGSVATVDREVVASRLIHAPRALLYEAFTDPKQVNQWWGPQGFKNKDVHMDVRVGGEWRFTMVGPDGKEYRNRNVFKELLPPERISYEHGEEGNTVFRSTITFEEVGQDTVVTVRLLFGNKETRDMVEEQHHAVEGAQQELEKLAAFVKGL